MKSGRAGNEDKSCVLGIDLGTSSCKVCMVDVSGRFLSRASCQYPTHVPRPGWAEQSAGDWLPAVAKTTKSLLERSAIGPACVVAIAVSSAAHIGVLLDSHSNPLRHAILWYDQRAETEARELAATHGQEIFHTTGNWVSSTWTLPQLVWIRRYEPQTWSKVRFVLLSKDYLVFQLSGQMATDPATALSSQLYSAQDGTWADPLCALAGLRPSMLPEVLSATTIVGRLTAPAAKRLGLNSGIPVVNGTLDSAAETYGAGAVQPGDFLLRLASAGGIHLVLDRARPHRRLISYPHPIAPHWYAQAGTNACTTAIEWAMQTLGLAVEQSFADRDELAENIPLGADGPGFTSIPTSRESAARTGTDAYGQVLWVPVLVTHRPTSCARPTRV